jgi:GT2 family glycosyltransferase
MPLAYIVILNWNGAKDTIACVESCLELNYDNYRILIVDNGSSDDSESVLRERFPAIDLLQTGKNLGFAGGNNVGIRYALEQGADFVWLLNNDTVVDSACLSYLVEAAESDKTIGMVGNKIYYLDKPEIIWFAGGEIDLQRGGLSKHIGKDHKDDGSYDRPVSTGFVTGCSILAKRAMIKDVGPMDEAYFLYFEDVDWNLSAQKQGWKLFYEPRAKLWHKEGAQTRESCSSQFIYYSLRNRLYFMKRFAPMRMMNCHLLQLKMILYFAKCTLRRGIAGCLSTLKLAAYSYIDFYAYKKMGQNTRL